MRGDRRDSASDRRRDARLEWLVAPAMIALLSLSLAQVFVLPHGEGRFLAQAQSGELERQVDDVVHREQ